MSIKLSETTKNKARSVILNNQELLSSGELVSFNTQRNKSFYVVLEQYVPAENYRWIGHIIVDNVGYLIGYPATQ